MGIPLVAILAPYVMIKNHIDDKKYLSEKLNSKLWNSNRIQFIKNYIECRNNFYFDPTIVDKFLRKHFKNVNIDKYLLLL